MSLRHVFTKLRLHRPQSGMDLKQLAYFVQVADLGSFTRASSLPGVAQQVVALVRELMAKTGRPLPGNRWWPTVLSKRMPVIRPHQGFSPGR
jgi:hypothetical protein